MADDNRSEDVNPEGEEEGSFVSESEAEPSSTSVAQQGSPRTSADSAAPPPPPPAPEPEPPQAPEPPPPEEVPEVQQAEPSQISIEPVAVEKSMTSVNLPEKSQMNIADSEFDGPPDLEDAGGAPVDLDADLGESPPQPQKEPEVPRYIEPMGQATEESLAQGEVKAFILDKMFHEGKMGRFGMVSMDSMRKMEEGGSVKYEDYKWQLDKMYREVPEDMALGKVRTKPDELLYEEEHWVLGKMFRDLREEDYGYMPIAEKTESREALDPKEAVEVSRPFPREPRPCQPPPSLEDDTDSTGNCGGSGSGAPPRSCFSKVTSPTGKIFEFSYAGFMEVNVDSTSALPGPSTGGPMTLDSSSQKPSFSFDPQLPLEQTPGDTSNPELTAPTDTIDDRRSSGGMAPVSQMSCSGSSGGGGAGVSDRTCRNKLRCESRIQAVCDAARKAMAIYDTVTGCDNFPCNEGDRPEKELENIEDGVWPWLYQLIFRMIPVDSNQNPMFTIPEESSPDDGQQ